MGLLFFDAWSSLRHCVEREGQVSHHLKFYFLRFGQDFPFVLEGAGHGGAASPGIFDPVGYRRWVCCFTLPLRASSFLQDTAIGGTREKQRGRHHSHQALGGLRAAERQGRHRGVCCLISFACLLIYYSFIMRRNHEMTPSSSGRKLCVLSHRVYFQFELLCDLDSVFMVSVHCEFQPLPTGNYIH